MGHGPVGYKMQFALGSDLTASANAYDAGDSAYVAEFDDYFTFAPASSAALKTGIILDGHGHAGRWILSTIHTFGGLYVTNGVAVQNLTTVPSLLTCWTGNLDAWETTPDHANDIITIVKPGTYQIAMSLSGPAAGTASYDFHIAKNGVAIPGAGIQRVGSPTPVPIGGTAISFASFDQNDVVSALGSVAVGASGITITEGSLTVVRMG
jgi:hypothetical protein